jgi:hypothetical protein
MKLNRRIAFMEFIKEILVCWFGGGNISFYYARDC